MTGLKSGSGDDLWGEDSADDDEPVEEETTEETTEPETEGESSTETDGQEQGDEESDSASEESSSASNSQSSSNDSGNSGSSANQQHPYIVRRAVQDKSVKFERDERLTFFVHDDVIEGERDLITDVESELGRNVPKFDVREAVYRAALRNRDDVLEELLNMGYSLDDS
ncbi:hypothetical protein [Halorussus halophilus]|uniref:hypothetical protein n=1 Tax=Halorussus halophilus TaxID=2650975 RepID=UPI0013017CBA|nr:hypothetical protein [Halorussus halophilus]